eukprot:scaffold16301_cov71-Isochrysis_galbana.AAC.3
MGGQARGLCSVQMCPAHDRCPPQMLAFGPSGIRRLGSPRLTCVQVVHALRQLHGVTDGAAARDGWLVVGDVCCAQHVQKRAPHQLRDHHLVVGGGGVAEKHAHVGVAKLL